MPKKCPECESLYPNFVDFCVEDGLRLERVVEPVSMSDQPNDGLSGLPSSEASDGMSASAIPGRARLTPKVHGEVGTGVIEFFGDVVLGRFDPKVGAVDIDLTDIPGQEYVSPRHAKLVYEDNRWFVEDLDSGTGVFIDQETRVTGRTPIENGQELALGNALFLFEADQFEEPEEREGDDNR